MSEKVKKFILDKRKEGKLVVAGIEGLMSMDVKEFIKQPVDGILYDLNRLEETALTFIEDPKWVNDFAVALTIRELYSLIESLRRVARAAEAAWPFMFEDIPKALNSKRAKYEHLYEALDAVPGWVLDPKEE